MKRNNNYWANEYSHKKAKSIFRKKAPNNIDEMVLETALSHWRNHGFFTLESIAKELCVLHRHVHKCTMKLMREGKVSIVRRVNISRGNIPNNAMNYEKPIAWWHDAWHDGARHPKLYTFK